VKRVFIFISEMQLILFKDNANRVKCKIKASETSFYFHFRDAAYSSSQHLNISTFQFFNFPKGGILPSERRHIGARNAAFYTPKHRLLQHVENKTDT